MSDNDELTDEGAQNENTTYTIQTAQKLEIDVGEREIQQMKQATDSSDPAQAIRKVYAQRARQGVEPEEKLVGFNVNVEENET